MHNKSRVQLIFVHIFLLYACTHFYYFFPIFFIYNRSFVGVSIILNADSVSVVCICVLALLHCNALHRIKNVIVE